jgi:hypothetical protein
MDTSELDPFVAHAPEFADVVGACPRLVKVIDTDAHEGPVYVCDEDALYFTSLPVTTDVPLPGSRTVAIRRLALDGDRFPRTLADLSTVRAVTTPGFPDGIKVDAAGRVYVSSASGVQVFSPAGDLLGEIRVPGAVNFTFGGRAGNVLFITADTAIWATTLQTVGR